MDQPPFLLWQDNSAPLKPEPPAPQPAPRTRTKKANKTAVPKRQPQRGLGVAQLERLRVQESFKEGVPHQNQIRALMAPYNQTVNGCLPNGLPGLYQLEQGYNVVRYEGAFGSRSCGNGTGFVIPDGPPSNQMVLKAAQGVSVPHMELGLSRCNYSDQCEFCVRKKRLFGEGSMYQTNCMDFMQMDHLSSLATVNQEGSLFACMEKKRSPPLVQRPTREYQFFPIFGGRSEMTNPVAGSASKSSSSSSSSSASFHPSQLLDLSLKL